MLTKIGNDFTEPPVSQLFLTHVSCVDHGYIDNTGCVVGGSFHPNFIIGGTPDPIEKVVVDFSTVKKDVKAAIDLHTNDSIENGFDHKLWVIEGYSLISGISQDVGDDGITYVLIVTPAITLKLPVDAVKMIRLIENCVPDYGLVYIGEAFRSHVYKHLEMKYPKIGLTVECDNTVDPHLPLKGQQFRYFNYVHGLKDSTSYGCQNVAHGHESFFQLNVDGPEHNNRLTQLYNLIADDLNGTVFVREENITNRTDKHLTLLYRTGRGEFTMVLDTNSHKVVVLPTETTVEFLSHYVVQKFKNLLQDENVISVYVSEGLSKGSIELV